MELSSSKISIRHNFFILFSMLFLGFVITFLLMYLLSYICITQIIYAIHYKRTTLLLMILFKYLWYVAFVDLFVFIWIYFYMNRKRVSEGPLLPFHRKQLKGYIRYKFYNIAMLISKALLRPLCWQSGRKFCGGC